MPSWTLRKDISEGASTVDGKVETPLRTTHDSVAGVQQWLFSWQPWENWREEPISREAWGSCWWDRSLSRGLVWEEGGALGKSHCATLGGGQNCTIQFTGQLSGARSVSPVLPITRVPEPW
jgi:hypothetical protein